MKQVWLLWVSDAEKPWVEAVFADKAKAEAAMRTVQVGDEGRGYLYWIQEKEVQS